MSKKIIFIIIAALLLLTGAFLWRNLQQFDLSQKTESDEQGPQGPVEELLFNLKQETGLDFSEISLINFQWNAIDQKENIIEKTVKGKRIELKDVSAVDKTRVEKYFEENGFVVDRYNLADGVVGSLAGYKRDHLICQISGLMRLNEEGLPDGNEIMDLAVNCAQVDFDPSPELLPQISIKKLLSEKYDKKLSQIDLEIEQQTSHHLRGSVFLDSELSDGEGNGGIFLAAKTGQEWELVFDGNGSFSCRMLEEYDFPEDMQTGCFSDPSDEEPISN